LEPEQYMTTTTQTRGGSWLLEAPAADLVFTPERLTEEHRLIAQTASEFASNEVLPAVDRLEQKDWATARALLKRCGDLGLLGVNVPEVYGGVELDQVSSLLVAEHLARSASFGAAYGAQANLCILPILLFGTDDQRQRYLPGLVSGDRTGAYALSESGSGSDALGARARATRQADGSFLLSGEKMWITNGGFADVFIVFAKVDGEHFSAFIVERAFGGVTSGKEEHKMGLHGSSTTPLVLQDVPVPAANLLGEVGKGHKVAFNVLNFGRFKLGAMCLGGCTTAIGESAKYAVSRQQFGQPIATFGAIRHKLGEMTARTYALESLMYRTAGLIDQHLAAAEGTHSQALLLALEEFAVEASIAKVAGSEILEYVLDQNVQVHGGNGFVHDYPAERHYRDARVNRIFEGTNEINRLLIPGMLMKRALKGELALIPAARRLMDEVMSPSAPAVDALDDQPLATEIKTAEAFKKVTLLGIGAAMQRFGARLQEEQEVLLWLADLAIETFAAESAVLRASAAYAASPVAATWHGDATRTFVSDASLRIEMTARQVLAALAEGDVLRTNLAALRRLLKVVPADTVGARRRLADETARRGRYLF
jgi:alkylation response protein AidB-like acyl-CoA dehydrogenase